MTPNTHLLCLYTHDLFEQNPRNKKKNIPFRFAIHNMKSKIIGLLVGAQDGKIMELRIKSGINNKSGINPVSLFSYVFQNSSGISWFLQNSGISFIVMANTIFLPQSLA
jgi:hypothetical protein